MKKIIALFSVVTLLLILGACRTSAIYNVDNAALVPTTEKAITLDDVKQAIIRAGAGLGWQMNPDNPGHMTGTLALRSHLAVVDINYTTKNYSINYKDSNNLNYNGKSIHSNYNGWIQNLQKAINNQMLLIN